MSYACLPIDKRRHAWLRDVPKDIVGSWRTEVSLRGPSLSFSTDPWSLPHPPWALPPISLALGFGLLPTGCRGHVDGRTCQSLCHCPGRFPSEPQARRVRSDWQFEKGCGWKARFICWHFRALLNRRVQDITKPSRGREESYSGS